MGCFRDAGGNDGTLAVSSRSAVGQVGLAVGLKVPESDRPTGFALSPPAGLSGQVGAFVGSMDGCFGIVGVAVEGSMVGELSVGSSDSAAEGTTVADLVGSFDATEGPAEGISVVVGKAEG